MKAYLIITGALFGLLALVHLWVTMTHWEKLTAEPGFIVEGPGIGLIGAALCLWAIGLLRIHLKLRSRPE